MNAALYGIATNELFSPENTEAISNSFGFGTLTFERQLTFREVCSEQINGDFLDIIFTQQGTLMLDGSDIADRYYAEYSPALADRVFKFKLHPERNIVWLDYSEGDTRKYLYFESKGEPVLLYPKETILPHKSGFEAALHIIEELTGCNLRQLPPETGMYRYRVGAPPPPPDSAALKEIMRQKIDRRRYAAYLQSKLEQEQAKMEKSQRAKKWWQFWR
jgi:hypothetical protein